ncbi:MAG: tetratricopeptide repeat protein [Planctomycetota bacterium]|jgi:tetratricopeptide (TPR) repeat protein
MSKLLEIFGKGLTVNTAEVVRHWLGRKLSQEEPSERTSFLIMIHDCLANRELIQAENKTCEYLSDFPECVLGRMAAAAVCLLQNELKEAIEQAQSVYLRQPSNTMALYVMGYCYERLGQIEQALEFYQDCIKFKSFLQLPRQRMAAIYLKEGQLDRAVKEYEILTSEHPDDISSIILLAELYLESNKAEQAIDTFNLGILSHPDNFMDSARDEEIQSLVECDMFEQALEAIKWTIEQVGPSQDLLIRMGDVYSQWEKESEAIACYENAILLQPSSLEARIKLGTHYLRNQRFSLAAEEFNKASDINDEILDAYMGLAIAQKRRGLEEESRQTLSLASSIQKNSVLLFTEAATLQFQSIVDENNTISKESDKKIVTIEHVIHAYQDKIKNTSAQADVYNKYGILMMNENRLQAAICAFENSISQNPMNYRVLYKLSICLSDNGQSEKAFEMLTSTKRCKAFAFEKYYQMTMLFCDKKAFAAAMKKACRIKSTDAYEAFELRADLEDIFESLGIIDRSYTSWERINETSACLLKTIEGKCHQGHP